MSLSDSNITSTIVSNAIGESSRSWSVLCRSDKINKWSRWKPVSIAKTTGLTDTDLSSTNYGFDIPKFIDSDNKQNWVYVKPTGGSVSPYRIGDFRNYSESSISPFILTDNEGIEFDVTTGASAVSFGILRETSSKYQLGLENLTANTDGGVINLGTAFVGVSVYTGTTTKSFVGWMSTKDDLLSIPVSVEGTYTFRFFFTDRLQETLTTSIPSPFSRASMDFSDRSKSVQIVNVTAGLDIRSIESFFARNVLSTAGLVSTKYPVSSDLAYSVSTNGNFLVKMVIEVGSRTVSIVKNQSYVKLEPTIATYEEMTLDPVTLYSPRIFNQSGVESSDKITLFSNTTTDVWVLVDAMWYKNQFGDRIADKTSFPPMPFSFEVSLGVEGSTKFITTSGNNLYMKI